MVLQDHQVQLDQLDQQDHEEHQDSVVKRVNEARMVNQENPVKEVRLDLLVHLDLQE